MSTLSGNDVVTDDRGVRKNCGVARGLMEEQQFLSHGRETDFMFSFPVSSKAGQCENTMRGDDDKSYEKGGKRGYGFPLLPFTLSVVL
jgi:hypothetical protein